MSDAITVGDQIRLSVTLLREMYDAPDHESPLVEVHEIQTERDGTKTLLLGRIGSGPVAEIRSDLYEPEPDGDDQDEDHE